MAWSQRLTLAEALQHAGLLVQQWRHCCDLMKLAGAQLTESLPSAILHTNVQVCHLSLLGT